MAKDKIGIGLITCDRPEFFKKSYESLKNLDTISFVIVDDGDQPIRDLIEWGEDNNAHYIKTKGKEGVGKAKNYALKYLNECSCEHLFLMEDDIFIKDSKVFDLYINTAKKTGIRHLNFGLHGNHNLDHNKKPIIRKTINYTDGTRVDLYPNILGAFSYYHISTINDCGYIDENFYNALEHVDHTYQIIKKGYHPPFRWFADAHGSKEYLEDIVEDHKESKIRSEQDFMDNFMKNLDIFVKKNNFSVINNYGPQEKMYNIKEVLEILKEIHAKHAEK
jgi:GT2 family glycosyltransferase